MSHMLYSLKTIWELTVAALLALLLAEFGSGCVPETLDERVRAPPAVGVTVMTAKALLSTPITSPFHMAASPCCMHVPPAYGVVAETNVELVGSVFVSTVFCPCEVLLF